MDVFCGIDWAEDHHDIALVGKDGGLLARLRISDDAAGLAALLNLLADYGDSPDDPIPVAIEARRQRRAQPWEARPPHAGPRIADPQIKMLKRTLAGCGGAAPALMCVTVAAWHPARVNLA